MEIKVEVDSDIIFLKLSGSIVAGTIEELRSQIQKLMSKRYLHIVFDLSRVDFIDSSGLGLCITTSRELAAASGKLVCCGLRENVMKLFTMTHADRKIVVMANRGNAFDYMFALLNEGTPEATVL